MTRPRVQSEGFLQDMPMPLAARLAPIISPLIEIAPIKTDIHIALDEDVIFTSVNGVSSAPKGQGQRAYCVGPATTQMAKAQGWQATMLGQTSAQLVDRLTELHPKARLWHLAGVHTRGQIAEKLGDAGLNVRHIALYDQALPDLTPEAKKALSVGNDVIVPLFSPRTAKQFAAQAPDFGCVHVIAISPAVAAEVAGLGTKSCAIADSPNAKGMVGALEKTVQYGEMG